MRGIDEKTGLVSRRRERSEAVKAITEALTPLLDSGDSEAAGAARRSLEALKAWTTEPRGGTEDRHWPFESLSEKLSPRSRSSGAKGASASRT